MSKKRKRKMSKKIKKDVLKKIDRVPGFRHIVLKILSFINIVLCVDIKEKKSFLVYKIHRRTLCVDKIEGLEFDSRQKTDINKSYIRIIKSKGKPVLMFKILRIKIYSSNWGIEISELNKIRKILNKLRKKCKELQYLIHLRYDERWCPDKDELKELEAFADDFPSYCGIDVDSCYYTNINNIKKYMNYWYKRYHTREGFTEEITEDTRKKYGLCKYAKEMIKHMMEREMLKRNKNK